MRELDSNGYQNKYWWGCEMGERRGESDNGKETKTQTRYLLAVIFIGSDDKVAN